MEKQNLKSAKNSKRFTIANFFKFEQRKATWKKELLGGVTAFLALIYMINVEQSYLNSAHIYGTFLIVCLTLGVGTIAMGLSTNTPVMATPAMGLNAMFAFNVAGQIDKSDPAAQATTAMLATMISTVLIIIICYTKLLTWVLKAIPHSLSVGITVAFGFYIAYVGFNNMGWFGNTASVGNYNDPGYWSGLPIASHEGIMSHFPGIILGMIVMFMILLFHFKKINGGVAISMIFGLIVAVIFANTMKDTSSIQASFGASKWVGWVYHASDFDFTKNFTVAFKNGIKSSAIWSNPTIYISVFLFTLITLFNISGAAYVIVMDDIAATNTPEFDAEVKKELRAIAVVGAAASVIGCSPVVNALETKAGMGQGARTGAAAVVSGCLFLVAIALLPIFKMMPACVTGAASVYIGFLMMGNITSVEWKEPEFLLAVGFMIIFSITTFSIVDGIAVGFITYSLISLFTKRAKQVSITMWILSAIFIAYFIASYFQ